MKNLIIAIDGPSGAGKSTLSKALATALGYVNIDTGAMYRSVAWLAHLQHIDPADTVSLGELCSRLTIEFRHDNGVDMVIASGIDVTTEIRTPEASLLTPKVAAQPIVREAMVRLQRKMGATGGVVLEGRDIGTVVFPHAEVKFYLSASAAERGKRRYEELQAKGIAVGLEQTISDVEDRDRADSEREHAPLTQAVDAVLINSTDLSIDEVLNEMLAVVKKRLKSDYRDPFVRLSKVD